MKNSEPLAVVILAAGLGKRMQSDTAKVMVAADGAPILDYVVRAALELNAQKIVVVTGYQRERVEAHLASRFTSDVSSKKICCAFQNEQRGTGDAVKAALPALEGFTGSVMILYGDIPLIRSKTLETLRTLHQKESATVTLLSVRTSFPAQYGRIMREASGRVVSIKEFKDCSEEERLINEINSGIYVIDSAFLPGAVAQIKNDNAQGEYYFTDIVAQAAKEGQALSCLVHFDLNEVQGVNNRVELAETSRALKQRRINLMIENGVTFTDPFSVDFSASVKIESGAIIGPHTTLSGDTIIEKGAIIEGFSVLNSTTVRSGAVVHQFVHATGAEIGADSVVGPFARLREGTILLGENKIGNFVETKNARLSLGAKASHLSYLGDCTVGERSNIGAGTITCNYDGKNKHKTTIADDAFIGSNTVLIAPVTVGRGAFIGAGSAISKDVEEDALALSRAEQKTIPGWAARRRT